MANAASTIEIELEIRQAIGRLNNLQKELNQTTQNFNKAADSTRNFEVAIGKAKTAAVAFFSVVTAKKIAEFSDVMTQFENRVKLATNSLNQQIAVQGELIKVAQQTATPLADIGELYSRMRLAAEQLGASQRDLINLTKTVGLTLKTQGTSATEASGALQQLGQAFTSPIVQAEEFNSIQDALPALLVQVTKNLGLQQGQLKKYVNDQKLSNKDLFDAILASQKALEQQANLAANTFESFGTRVNNTVTSSIGALSRFMGAKLTKEFTNFKEAIFDTFPALDSFMTKLGKALTIGPGLLDKFTRLVVLGEQPPEEGGGEANLDEIIKDQTNLITDLEASFKGLSIYATTQIMAISEAFEDSNLTIEEYTKKVEAFVKSYTEFYDKVDSGELPGFPSLQFDPETQEQLFLSAEQARKEFELIFKFIAQGFKAFENLNGEAEKYLTYLERITNYLSEQLRLLELSEENANRTAGAIVSGISGAGPNASRAANIAQSKSLDEAAVKLILSNEKVAKAIDSSFELLFEVLDPILDILGDLLSAINRLIGALLENATNAAEGLLDTVGLGPNGYIFGGGLARDLEDAFSSSRPGGPTNQQKAFAQADSIFENIADAPSTRDELQPTIDELADLIPDLGLTEVINRITQNTEEAVASLEAVQEINFKTLAAASSAPYLMNQIGKEIKKVNQKIAETEEKSKIVIQGLIEAYIQEPLNALDDLTQSAQDQIDAIDFQNMSIEEQIEFRYQESIATIEQQKALADLIDDEALRTQLLNAVNRAEAKTLELKNKQLAALEREQQLLALQNVESGLQALLSDFERTIEKIDELVQGLFDQVQELLFSDFSPLGPQEQFAQAQSTYESLLENAFDADATEEDIKLLQGFVNEYLTAARNVFKSSTAFTSIFEGVLGDLTGLGLQTSVNAPIQASSNLSSDLEEILSVLDEDFAEVVNSLIASIDTAALAFAQQQIEYITEVAQIPLTLSGDDIVIDTSGISETVKLTSDNFSLDSTNLDLSLAMSTSMFTVDTSGLNFGTITPTATAGTPNLGTITPTVSLNASSVTNSFDSLSSAINSAIQSFNETLAEAAIYARLGFDYEGYSQFSTSFQARTSNTDSAEQARFGLTSILEQAKEVERVYNKTGYGYAVSYNHDGGMGVITLYKNLADAQSQYNVLNAMGTHTNIKKLGFRRGGIVDPMDTIPAMLSPGEYILSPETVRRYGVSNLNRLNSGDTAALNATSDPEVKRLLAELIVAVRENDTEVNVYTDMAGQTKAGIEEFRSELRERTRRQGEQYVPARYI